MTQDPASPAGRVSIGLLAHDEESRIVATLDGLLAQDVFDRFDTELVVVANGCSDRTVEVARAALERHRARWSRRGSARVEDLPTPGKANAWNEFVHRLSAPAAAYLVLVDADIWFLGPDTISTLVDTLARTPRAVVAVDRPLKDAGLERRSLLKRLLGAATPTIDPNDVPLCGQLYCARSAAVREVRFPPEIQVEDGFLRGLLLTQLFTAPEDRGRIVLAPAAHGFASVDSLAALVRHERWVVSGSIVNIMLFERFHAEARPGHGAVALMAEWAARDPRWLARFVEGEVAKRGWNLLPRWWWTRRWMQLQGLPPLRLLKKLPVAIAAAAFDALIFLGAIRDVRQGRGYRYWRSA